MPDPDICQSIAEASVATELATGCPAEVLFAQCALESGWLKSAPLNNCFGIKSTVPHGSTVESLTATEQLLVTVEWMSPEECQRWLDAVPGREAIADGNKNTSLTTVKGGRVKWKCKDWFATFPSLADCFNVRATVFNHGRYAPAFDTFKADHDLTKFIRAFAPVYATDGSYADKLIAIISEAPVQAALASARSAHAS